MRLNTWIDNNTLQIQLDGYYTTTPLYVDGKLKSDHQTINDLLYTLDKQMEPDPISRQLFDDMKPTIEKMALNTILQHWQGKLRR